MNDALGEGVRGQNADLDRVYGLMDCKVALKDGRVTIKPGPNAISSGIMRYRWCSPGMGPGRAGMGTPSAEQRKCWMGLESRALDDSALSIV